MKRGGRESICILIISVVDVLLPVQELENIYSGLINVACFVGNNYIELD